MCGRYAASTPRDDLQALYEAGITVGDDLGPRYNVAPTDPVDAILERREDDAIVRQVRTARWGLVPSWAHSLHSGPPLINARIETVATKPAWRNAYPRRRAIVPADGYYLTVTRRARFRDRLGVCAGQGWSGSVG